MQEQSVRDPLVSVIVPVLNGELYLRESLDSILAQSYSRIEVLVLDDASTDATPAILESYGDAIETLRQPSNVGIYENANVGIDRACGDFIAVFHADDIYLPTIVEREVEFLVRHPEAGAVFASDIFIDSDGMEYSRLLLPPEVRGNRLLHYGAVVNGLLEHKNAFLRCPGAMVRATVYDAVGVYRQDTYRNTSDLDMWLRIARRYPIAVLEEHLFKYRHFHGSSGERYHHLRTEPGRTFTILSDYLEDDARAVATPRALAAFEAHRAEDALMRSIAHYVLDQSPQARATLADAPLDRLLGSPCVNRFRLAALWAAIHVLSRLPRSEAIANAVYRRWHAKRRGG